MLRWYYVGKLKQTQVFPPATGNSFGAGPAIGENFVVSGRNGRTSRSILPRSARGRNAEGHLWTALLIYGAFAAYKILPAYVAQYQLADKMTEQARFSIVNHYTEEQVRDTIYKVVQDLDIPVKKEQIKVVSTNSVVRISMEYTVPVDLLVYHMDLHFTPSSENKALM